MSGQRHRRGPVALAPALLLSMAIAAPAAAQDGFLFGTPVATLTLMGGWAEPGERSDLFEFTREHLTVERGAFSSPVVFGEAAYRVSERVDLALGLEHTSRTVGSEMRDWVQQDGSPISQSTTFSRTRLLGSVKGYLLPRGRTISQLAWVPYPFSPYVGGGAGYSAYEFVQEGDFVDVQTLGIFDERLTASGGGVTAHVLGGAQLSLGPRLALRAEYRYVWGDGAIGADQYGRSDFDNFEGVDLSGWQAMVGLTLRVPARGR